MKCRGSGRSCLICGRRQTLIGSGIRAYSVLRFVAVLIWHRLKLCEQNWKTFKLVLKMRRRREKILWLVLKLREKREKIFKNT
ncbi:hypothetical protein HanRHA438_Chr13g0610061 [Helianthus annuus]|uniref:Uncharacterized protein n=1 Tax=Helianthus annuus TaxID=4232 RepID=A0A251SXT3_HELAN|nr:hypothetical protein HanXRQr2_Chr13g0599501 [Helianthus annuus]KAJ0477723.1 hypothetical protein HanHA300_Chr13g0491821 [Helianthus annuus]KAJ0482278.1 hypothetical protein HanIR_Chr13g0652111 [Helianthus annuus]KAJ0498555.1 hypothetical protein HanHA89_Chr13g0523941 [Helianthus annuus]KAJ0664569.1 hypothetical protein HanLR1_Chr13g0493931 [Helianthus annuus]